MAEVAGLVLGAVGIAGVISSFKDTIELFNLLADTRYFGRDYVILETKLDIEKTLLLRWADGVNLLQHDYDRRLDSRETLNLVARVLSSIALLLTHTPDLKARYGLVEQPEPGELVALPDTPNPECPRYGSLRLSRFLTSYDSLHLHINKNQKTTPLYTKIRWRIRDKEKFESLIRQLEYFRGSLNEIVPVHAKTDKATAMDAKDLKDIKDIGYLKILLDASLNSQRSIAASAQNAIIETSIDYILSKLWFRKIDERKDSISEPHPNTLQWVFEPSERASLWADLPTWLQSGSGIYWLSGKAGSGKSTLMKHIYSDRRTKDRLLEWSNGLRLTIGNFFFMDLGTVEQKSQEGLSRTLLFQILSENRSLVPKALPNMWRELQDNIQGGAHYEIDLPSMSEMKNAFHIIGNSQNLGKFCFFIDGLDEFIGDCIDGATFIRNLAVNESFKVLVSSRPVPACVACFKHQPQLRLQDLNHSDITSYVNDTVKSHSYMTRLIKQNPEEGDAILHDLVEKSCGVFLWVVLACRSLLNGFADHDRLEELRLRVDELPPELEDMFKSMLEKIDKRHREQGSSLLRMCYMLQSAPWLSKNKGIIALGITMAIDYRTRPVSVRILEVATKHDLIVALEGRLRSRCGGLLELSCKGLEDREASESHNFYMDMKIMFMHRTVFEFLSNETVWKLPCLQMPGDGFDVSTALSFYGVHIATQTFLMEPSEERDHLILNYLWDGIRWTIQGATACSENVDIIFTSLHVFLDELKATNWKEPSTVAHTTPILSTDSYPKSSSVTETQVNHIERRLNDSCVDQTSINGAEHAKMTVRGNIRSKLRLEYTDIDGSDSQKSVEKRPWETFADVPGNLPTKRRRCIPQPRDSAFRRKPPCIRCRLNRQTVSARRFLYHSSKSKRLY